MCKISNQLKLCTCKTNDVQSLKYYWVLKSPNTSGSEILGEIMMPADVPLETELHNQETLTKLLNAGNCFDVRINHLENDVLELHFSCKYSYLVYAFIFWKNKWELTEYDPFGNGLDDKLAGKIMKPYVK